MVQRHGITREQGLSIASNDSDYNPNDPSKMLVTFADLFSWGGQQNDFFSYLSALSADKGKKGEMNEYEISRANYVQEVVRSPARLRQLFTAYELSHQISDGESVDEYARRCAEQDFEDGEAGCIFPELYRRTGILKHEKSPQIDCAEAQIIEPPTARVVISVSGGVVQYASSNTPICLVLHDENHLTELMSSEEQTALLDKVAFGCTELAIQSSHTFAEVNSPSPSEVQHG